MKSGVTKALWVLAAMSAIAVIIVAVLNTAPSPIGIPGKPILTISHVGLPDVSVNWILCDNGTYFGQRASPGGDEIYATTYAGQIGSSDMIELRSALGSSFTVDQSTNPVRDRLDADGYVANYTGDSTGTRTISYAELNKYNELIGTLFARASKPWRGKRDASQEHHLAGILVPTADCLAR